MLSKYQTAIKNYYESYNKPETNVDIIAKTWFLCIIQIHLLCHKYWRNYKGERLSNIYAEGQTFFSDVVWVKLSAIYWLWRLCYDIWVKPIKDFGETKNDALQWDRLVRKFGDSVRKVICQSCDELLGYYVNSQISRFTKKVKSYDHYLSEFGEITCDLETQYVGYSTEYIWSAKDLEGDICQGCCELVCSQGIRFKIYKGELRYDIIFSPEGLVYDVIACKNAELHSEYEHIIYWLIDGKQDEVLNVQANNELFPIDLPRSYSYRTNNASNVKHRLIKLADTFDIPLFRLGCSDYSLQLWTNKESHDLFQAIACELEHDPEKDLDFEQIAKDYELEIVNDLS